MMRPEFSLIQTFNADPTVGPGINGLPFQFLYRSDVPSLYIKTGNADTAWTRIGMGSAITGFQAFNTGRALNVVFQSIDPTKPTLCIYTVQIAVDDGEDGLVELKIDAGNPPVNVVSSGRGKLEVAGVIGLTGDSAVRATLIGLCPAGQNILIQSTNTAGAPTFFVAQSIEIVIS